MNYGRVVLGGLVAGLILNIGEFVLNGVLLHKAMVEWASLHNFPAEPAPSFMVVAIGLTFVLGIVMVWLYALIRPRMGPGPKTAIVAALVMWFGVCLYCGIIYGLLLQQPTNLLLIAMGWCLGEYVIAAIAGAWLYKEV
ncbi:MAG TPA: hypothetical protein VIT19_11520 [Pyrinomonadaceae bacterium]